MLNAGNNKGRDAATNRQLRSRRGAERLLYMLCAVEETARWTSAKIAAIRSLSKHTVQFVREQLPKTYSRVLVDVIFEQPYCRIGNVIDKQITQRQAASQHLKELVAIGVLQEAQAGKEKQFIHLKLMQLLTRDSNVSSLTPAHRLGLFLSGSL